VDSRRYPPLVVVYRTGRPAAPERLPHLSRDCGQRDERAARERQRPWSVGQSGL